MESPGRRVTNGSEDVTTEFFLATKANGGTAGVRV